MMRLNVNIPKMPQGMQSILIYVQKLGIFCFEGYGTIKIRNWASTLETLERGKTGMQSQYCP